MAIKVAKRKSISEDNRGKDLSGIRACGILFCYNEEQILAETLKHYLNQGIDLVVFDNHSTDSSMEIVNKFRDNKERYRGRIRDVIDIETQGYEWEKILRSACDYMHRKLNHCDWILLIDSDAFFYSPVTDMNLLDFINTVGKLGYNIIDGKVYEFYPTEKDDPAIASPVERIKYYKDRSRDKGFVSQAKVFRYHPTIDFYSHHGHACNRQDPRVFEKIKFIYKHYPWTSYEHGLRKVFKERKPRYIEQKRYPRKHLHVHLLSMLPLKEDFVRQSQELQRYDEKKVLLSKSQFFWTVKLAPLVQFRKACVRRKRHATRLLKSEIKRLVILIAPKKIYVKLYNFIESIKSKVRLPRKKGRETAREAYVFDFPEDYHFLMTNYCNARCIFCNQEPYCGAKKELTLKSFKTMISNIPIDMAKVFYFSGGGEPLLCRDLIPIIEYVNTSFPRIEIRIRTNGLLIGKYAKDLARLNISRLEISIHGLPKTNDYILQIRNSQDIFSGMALLNEHLKNNNKEICKILYPTVSRLNIGDLPALIKKAAGLKIDKVIAIFCRYYPQNMQKADQKLKEEDSLFFHKKLYNNVIGKARKAAESSGIYFYSEPLFFEKVKKRSCVQPWELVVVDWDGDIYPCCGGEVWFDAKVKTGKYHFGNLLKEDLGQCWNNTTYMMLRRTCSRDYKEDFIPECKSCHNALCFKGPDVKSGHILKMPDNSVVVKHKSNAH